MTALLLMVIATSPVPAETISIDLPGAGPTERRAITYQCPGASIRVEYINAASNSLAVLTLGQETIVAASVLAGSGVRYAGRQYVWWTKGAKGDLYDLTKGDKAKPLSCSAAS